MSSDDEEVLHAVNLVNILNAQGGQKRVHNYWVHPFWRQNCNDRGAYAVFKDLEDDDRFQSFYRMKKETFELLIQLVGPKIQKKDTNFRRAVCPRERLLITLRYNINIFIKYIKCDNY